MCFNEGFHFAKISRDKGRCENKLMLKESFFIMKFFEHPVFFVVVRGRLGIVLRKNATVGIVIFSSVIVSAICDSISLLFGKK